MISKTVKRWACVVACAAVLARAIIPAGFMPDLNAVQNMTKPFSMVICTINGAKTITVGGDFAPVPHKNAQICDFALGLSDGAVSPSTNALPLPALLGFALLAYFYALNARRISRGVLAPARAPPRFR